MNTPIASELWLGDTAGTGALESWSEDFLNDKFEPGLSTLVWRVSNTSYVYNSQLHENQPAQEEITAVCILCVP
jgi:hypothetical protein